MNKTPEEIKVLANLARIQRYAKKQERKEALEQTRKDKQFAQHSALRLHNKHYSAFLKSKRTKGKTVDRKYEQELLGKLEISFPVDIGEMKTDEVDETFEISKLRYHKPVYKQGMPLRASRGKPGMSLRASRGKPDLRPTTQERFSGMMKNPKEGGKEILTENLDPKWVRYHFHSIFVELVMLTPEHWFPVPVGNKRYADEKAPENLLVRKVAIRYQQFDQNYCLLMGVASCLDYCGEEEAAVKLKDKAWQFENLTRDLAIRKLKEAMLKFVPCIGDCTLFNVRNAKKRTIKKLTIEDLISTKTRFPTVIIPLGNDGSYNHAVVVIDDIIFDSTQEFALKLCRESLDWICGEKGIASIYIGLRFNRGNATKDKLQHVDTVNW
jgi:hypothetical protein